MRAYRLCAVFSRASSRPRIRRHWSLVWALMAGLCVPSALASASERVPVGTPSSPRPAAHAYFGILGEVVCPGVYELPPGATFGQLVSRAGGITPDANGNSRVFRGGRVAQQLFVS